jgi:hypothetical protein
MIIVVNYSHMHIVFIIFTLANRLMKKLQLTLPTYAQVGNIILLEQSCKLLIIILLILMYHHYQDIDDLGNADDITLCQNTSVQQNNSELTCVIGFYLDNSTRPVCIPHCKSWLNVKTSDIVVSICQSLSIVTCIVLFIIMRFQRHTM